MYILPSFTITTIMNTLVSRLFTDESEAILDQVRHHLYHDLPRLSKATLSALLSNPNQRICRQESEHHRTTAETV